MMSEGLKDLEYFSILAGDGVYFLHILLCKYEVPIELNWIEVKVDQLFFINHAFKFYMTFLLLLIFLGKYEYFIVPSRHED